MTTGMEKNYPICGLAQMCYNEFDRNPRPAQSPHEGENHAPGAKAPTVVFCFVFFVTQNLEVRKCLTFDKLT